MSTAHKTEEEKKEIFDSEEEIESKCLELGELIKGSEHFVCFTGAGISTTAGIPDYRSGTNTILKAGPGAWEKKAVGEEAKVKKCITTRSIQAIPTKTHMSFVKLEEEGILKFVISQNTDGLHKRSGLPAKVLAELHGNGNLERCSKCKRGYMRDYRTRTAGTAHTHANGRRCEDPKCQGALCDTIVNFGENLPEWELNEGFRQGDLADLHLCMGSSLRVTPAADMPLRTTHNGGKLVIVNLQKTPLDHLATIRIGAMCDDVIQRVMTHLHLQIPQFILRRRVKFSVSTKSALEDMFGKSKISGLMRMEKARFQLIEKMEKLKIEEIKGEEVKEIKGVGMKGKIEKYVKGKTEKYEYLLIQGIESDGLPFSLFPKVIIKDNTSTNTLTQEPYTYSLAGRQIFPQNNINVILYFQGHYNEPPLDIHIDIPQLLKEKNQSYLMELDPTLCKWINLQLFH